jgi:hypothetical protein
MTEKGAEVARRFMVQEFSFLDADERRLFGLINNYYLHISAKICVLTDLRR